MYLFCEVYGGWHYEQPEKAVQKRKVFKIIQLDWEKRE